MDTYDVIIIGTGAGGGTLARHLAPSGKRILLLERGDWLPRELQNWLDRGRVRGQPLRLAGHVVRRERQALPAGCPLLRRRGDEALRRGAVPAPQGGLRRAPAPRRHLARLADLLRRARAVLHARRAALPRARRARRGPDRAAGQRAVPASRPSRTSRGSSSSPTTSRPRATTRSTRRAGSCSTSRTRRSRPASAVRPATASRASCMRSPTPRCSACGPALEHPNVTLLTNAKVVKLETNDGRYGRHRGRRRARRRRGAVRRRRRRRRVRRGQHGQAAPGVGERQAPERPRQRLRPGRPQLHVPRLDGRPRALARGEPDRLPEDARAQRLLLRRATTSSTRWGTSRWSASRRRRCSAASGRGETKLAPEWTLERMARHAIDFWLSTEDLPRPDNRVTVDGDGKITLTTRRRTPRPRSSSTRRSSRCSASST